MFPPRSHWPRPIRRQRRQTDDTPKLSAAVLAERALREIARDSPRYEWARRLRKFVNECRERALTLNPESVFVPEKVFAVPKDRSGNDQKYRILAKYTLQDGLIASGFAAYFRDLIESQLSSSCYAFRAPRDGNVTTHHDAVTNLRRFVAAIPLKRRVWVAECDIQGFFDAVSHEVARSRLDASVTATGSTVDARAVRFLDAFFAGYDYESAVTQATRQLLDKEKVSRPVLFDPRNPKAPALPAKAKRVGLPQGSAMSGVVANAVLSEADKSCLARLALHQKSFYARYCDDIIIVSSNRRKCEAAMHSYSRALRVCELPAHAPALVAGYTVGAKAAFWNTKSKRAYQWSAVGSANGVPWVGFLGYQLSRDGRIRVRLASVEKERRKQRKVVDEVVSRLVRSLRVGAQTPDGKRHRIRQPRVLARWLLHHLVSFGVGYPAEWVIWPAASAVCWCRGFRLLRQPPADLHLLRLLDRKRDSALARFRGRIGSLVEKAPGLEAVPGAKPKGTLGFTLKFAGKPLSYYAQFTERRPKDPTDGTIVPVSA